MKLDTCCLILVLGVGGIAGCSKDAEPTEPQPGASQGNEAPPSSTATTTTGNTDPTAQFTDGQILEIVATVDAAEIEQARVALTKATNPQVRDFATSMIEEHSASQQAGAKLGLEGGLTRAETCRSRWS